MIALVGVLTAGVGVAVLASPPALRVAEASSRGAVPRPPHAGSAPSLATGTASTTASATEPTAPA
ncbi:hypothetical protein, partial [Cellulomonas sp. IC4_254]|uniref:hypothetical protein n=1 Tax=Cellulomonas sp. IC4_254 TaxID=2714040 RepID=UPI00196A87A1